MRIDARSKTVRELLSNVKYGLDYFQREYRWETRQVEELLGDLETKFLSNYDPGHERSQVQGYDHYFLGSVVVNHKEGKRFIIDGQQRTTTLTMLLIYLHHLVGGEQGAEISPLIFSTSYGQKSFNLDVPDRTPTLEALYAGLRPDGEDDSESVRNMERRYLDIDSLFPETLKDEALPYFVDWLMDNVEMVEITAFSDDDAYTIFETMNDRGLSLTPTEMLKGYLLANITDAESKERANDLWKDRVLELLNIGEKEEDSDFFKAWLRAKYAETIRERNRGAANRDFEKIATAFNKWVRDERERLGLIHSSDFREFVLTEFPAFQRHYARMRRAAIRFDASMPYVYYNAHNNFTLQYPLMLAALSGDDDPDTADRKMRLVSGFVDIYVVKRLVNFHSTAYSGNYYTMFGLMKELRGLELPAIADLLRRRLAEQPETWEGVERFYLNQWSRNAIHHILARLTYYVEQQSGMPTEFDDYISRRGVQFEVEHVWADKPERWAGVFASDYEFREARNRLGGLVLLPKQFNAAFGALPYEEKLPKYFGQNILPKSLHPECYTHHPAFKRYVDGNALPFHPYPDGFGPDDQKERQHLYRLLCEEVWSEKRFDLELQV